MPKNKLKKHGAKSRNIINGKKWKYFFFRIILYIRMQYHWRRVFCDRMLYAVLRDIIRFLLLLCPAPAVSLFFCAFFTYLYLYNVLFLCFYS